MSANLDSNAIVAPAVEKKAAGGFVRTAATVLGAPLWVVVCMFVLATSVFILLFRLFPALEPLSKTVTGQLISNAAIYALAVFFVLLPARIRKKTAQLVPLLGFSKKLTLGGAGWAVVAFVIYFWTTILVSLLASHIPGFNAEQAQDVGFSDVTTITEYIAAFIGLVILPPIFEETLFRGYLFGRLRQRVGFWFSAIVTSAIFGLVHGQWNVGVDTFVLSIFLCTLREYTGSLWASMLLHALKNGMAYFFLFIAPLLGINLL